MPVRAVIEIRLNEIGVTDDDDDDEQRSVKFVAWLYCPP